jgi:hypothetical protein
MLSSLVKKAATTSVRRSVQPEAIVATQLRSYAKGKGKAGKEIKNAFKQIPNRFIRSMPSDMLQPVTVPKISMSMMRGTSYVLKNVRCDKIELDTVEEGAVVVYPNTRTTLLRLQPGIITVCLCVHCMYSSY